MNETTNTTDVTITLSEAEAWILFELSLRFSETDELTIKHAAEERALWNLCCMFEQKLQNNSDLPYADFIEQCQQKLCNE